MSQVPNFSKRHFASQKYAERIVTWLLDNGCMPDKDIISAEIHNAIIEATKEAEDADAS